MQHLKITAIGNSAGIILSKDILAQLGVEKGDSLSVVRTPNGIELSPYDPTFDEQMEVARGVMARYRDALRELAK
ncbi:transcriptional regulator [Polymorphobacter glacialis]|uniref:Transcriptional regulator n=1 Tax=Sandarakinorhabdus glacialis TaxID=1614636 RepID=A0A917E9U9_9SPHN|nr:AbrB/MazE/SpoVT family DNA-binding domain-containing protein [Polymorphobacter glacialis]GGE13285.1 transcriptional regulator [Polymorphobacter glacialis]